MAYSEYYDFYEELDAESSDQLLWDENTLARVEQEWNPVEEDDIRAIDDAMDPVLQFAGDVPEDPDSIEAPISTATGRTKTMPSMAMITPVAIAT